MENHDPKSPREGDGRAVCADNGAMQEEKEGQQANDNNGTLFAHYFLTFGWEPGRPLLTYDENSIRVRSSSTGGGSSRGPPGGKGRGSESPLQVAFKAALLARYPEQDRADVPFPPHTWMFCFPQGMVLKEKDPPKPLYFPVVLTAEDGTQLYGACLTFYEQLTTAEVHDLYEAFYAEADRRSTDAAPKSPKSSKEDDPAGSLVAPSPASMTALTPTTTTATTAPSSVTAATMRALPKRLYAPKSICILSRHSFTLFFRDWLCGLYSLSKELPASMIDSFIVQLLDQVPLPLPSVGLSLTIGERQAILNPSDERFPRTDIPLHFLFEVLDIDNVLLLFSAVLMEQKLLLISSQFTLLTFVAESIRSLVYPFEWQHVMVPVLPACLAEFVGSPTPFVMGLHKSYFRQEELAPHAAEVVVVDLDHNRIVVPEAVRGLMPPLPEPEHAILVSELRKFLHNDLFYLDDYYSSSRAAPVPAAHSKRLTAHHGHGLQQQPAAARHQSIYQALSPRSHYQPPAAAGSSSAIALPSTGTGTAASAAAAAAGAAVRFDEAIRHAFLLFFVSLFRNYRDHLTYIRVFPEPMAIFNKRNFLDLRPDAAAWFEPFLETQLFTGFLNRHSWPRANVFDQSIDAALFDLELDQVLAQLPRPTAPPRVEVIPPPPLSFHPGSFVNTDRFPLIGRPVTPAASGGSGSGDDDESATSTPAVDEASGEGEAASGGGTRVPILKKKIIRRKSRFGKLPPLPGLGSASSAESSDSAEGHPAAQARSAGAEANGTAAEGKSADGGGEAQEEALGSDWSSLSTTPPSPLEEKQRERRWLASCMQCLFEHSEEKGGRALDTEDMSKLFELLKDEALRLQFARALELEVQRSPKEGQLSGRSFAQLTELMKACLREASNKDDFVSCGLVMEAAFHFNYTNPKLQGVQDFVHSHLTNHDAWQNLRFWERSFYDKVKEEFNKLYEGGCRQTMRLWDSFEQAKREELIAREENIIFDCLATFAYKMLTLGTSVELVRRFVGKMSTAAQLNEERTTVIEQLLSNMTRASELTAELEASSRRSSLRPYEDFEEGGEEQEYIPVAGLNDPRHSESAEGRKKFEVLLKAKSTQTRAFLTRLTVARAGVRDKLNISRSATSPRAARTDVGKKKNKNHTNNNNKGGRKAKKGRKGSDSDDLRSGTGSSDDDAADEDAYLVEERNDYVMKTLTGHTEAVMCVKLHDNTVYSGSCDGSIKVWNAFSAKCTTTLTGHTGWVNSLHLDHDKERLVSGSYDKLLKLWDLHKECKIRSLLGHEGSICCLQGDLPTVVSGSFDGTMRLWDVRVGKNSQTFKGHTGPVVCLQFHDAKREILTGSRDATLKLWDARTLKCVTTLAGHRDWIRCLQFDPATATAYSGSCDTTVKKWNLATGQCELSMMSKGRTGAINDLCFLDGLKVEAGGKEKMPTKGGVGPQPSPRALVTGSARGNISLWNGDDGTCIQTIKAAHADEVVHCRPVGTSRAHVVTAGYDGLLRLWAEDELNGGLRCAATFDGHEHRVLCLDTHETKIASGSYDRTIRVWELPLDLLPS